MAGFSYRYDIIDFIGVAKCRSQYGERWPSRMLRYISISLYLKYLALLLADQWRNHSLLASRRIFTYFTFRSSIALILLIRPEIITGNQIMTHFWGPVIDGFEIAEHLMK